MTDKPVVKRFAAKLLFQFRVMVDGSPGARRLCEERIVTLTATNAKAALAEAKRIGRAARYRYKNAAGNPVHFELVGVMELLCLGSECRPNEVWYDIVERMRPMERRAALIPPESKLCAITNNE